MNPLDTSPFILQPPTKQSSSNSFIAPILLLISICFIILLLGISSLNESFEFKEYDYDVYPVSIQNDYKKDILKNQDCVRLIKGTAKIIHHNIKQDSIILLSRKTIEGKPGNHLVIDEIVSNEYFIINAVDEDNNVVETDMGEIYYIHLR